MKKGNLESIAQGITALLHPNAEVVIHDLSTQKISAIFNNFSNRKAGDPSLLDPDVNWSKESSPYGPYEKTNWDGQPLHSVTIILKDDTGQARALLCINVDVSVLKQAQALIGSFVNQRVTEKPESLFKGDWKERIHTFVHGWLRTEQKNLDSLTQQEKRLLVLELKKQGAFKAKHAAQHVADTLNVSRPTVYNHLRS